MAIEIEELFPTPVMTIDGVFTAADLAALRREFDQRDMNVNKGCETVTHSSPAGPGAPETACIEHRLEGVIGEFGRLLLGEMRSWTVHSAWLNIMKPGSQLGLHNHANSVISGVVYCSDTDVDSTLTFHRSVPTSGPFLRNDHSGVAETRFNETLRRMPAVREGGVILFPSHLFHTVPVVSGTEDRISIAFNALPDRLLCGGYEVEFSV